MKLLRTQICGFSEKITKYEKCILMATFLGGKIFDTAFWKNKVDGTHNFFRVILKAFISIRMTLGTIQIDYFDYVRHVWDIFGTIRPLKIIFWDYIFENFRPKMNKNTFFSLLWPYKGNYYMFKLRNEEFRCLLSFFSKWGT